MKVRLPKIAAHALKIIIICVFAIIGVLAIVDIFTGTYFGHAALATKIIVFTALLSIAASVFDPKSWITIEEENTDSSFEIIRNPRVTKSAMEAYELLDKMGWPIKKFRFVLVKRKDENFSQNTIGGKADSKKRVVMLHWTGEEPEVNLIAFTLVSITCHHPLCEGLDPNPLLNELHETLND